MEQRGMKRARCEKLLGEEKETLLHPQPAGQGVRPIPPNPGWGRKAAGAPSPAPPGGGTAVPAALRGLGGVTPRSAPRTMLLEPAQHPADPRPRLKHRAPLSAPPPGGPAALQRRKRRIRP